MNSLSAQKKVYESVVKRGYRNGWTSEQYLARQIAKLIEELYELLRTLDIEHPKESIIKPEWYHLFSIMLTERARHAFDFYGPDEWVVEVRSLEEVKRETADLQVVLFQIASAISEMERQPFDVVQAAVNKASDDVERGIR